MLNRLFSFILLVFSIFFFDSCRKIDNQIEGKYHFTVKEAKDYFNINYPISEPYSYSSAIYSSKTERLPIDWTKADVYESEEYFIVQVPLLNKYKIRIGDEKNNETLTNLLILKEKNNNYIHSAIMAVSSDKSDLKSKQVRYRSLPDDFSGKVFYTDWYGNFMNGWKYINGNIEGLYNAQKLSNNHTINKQPVAPLECGEVIIDTWERWCDQNGNCTNWELIYSTPYNYCWSGGGNGGGSIFITNSTALDIVTPDTSITNNAIVNCVYQKLMSAFMQNGLKAILSAFNDNNSYNVKFILEDLSAEGLSGKTHYDWLTSGIHNFTISINSADALDPNYSRVWLASTFIHEAFHAKLRQKAIEAFGTSVISSWPKSIEDMDLAELARYYQQEGQKTNYWESIGHNWMMNHVNIMATSIREYVQKNYTSGYNQIGSDLDKYKGLAFMGLEQTSLYQTEVIDKGLQQIYIANAAALVNGFQVCDDLPAQ